MCLETKFRFLPVYIRLIERYILFEIEVDTKWWSFSKVGGPKWIINLINPIISILKLIALISKINSLKLNGCRISINLLGLITVSCIWSTERDRPIDYSPTSPPPSTLQSSVDLEVALILQIATRLFFFYRIPNDIICFLIRTLTLKNLKLRFLLLQISILQRNFVKLLDFGIIVELG